jgi:hypothetical protein
MVRSECTIQRVKHGQHDLFSHEGRLAQAVRAIGAFCAPILGVGIPAACDGSNCATHCSTKPAAYLSLSLSAVCSTSLVVPKLGAELDISTSTSTSTSTY